MKPIRFLGHPLHPAVIHFPMAFLALPFPLELTARWTHREECLLFALAAESLGVAAAILALVTGLMDYAALKGRHDEAIPRATLHMMVMLSAMAAFVADLALRWVGQDSFAYLRLGLSGIGLSLLLFGGWLGADLIFRYGVFRSDR